MSTRKAKKSLGNPVTLPGRKRPFAYSTQSESDMLRYLAQDHHTWNTALTELTWTNTLGFERTYAHTEVSIIRAFIDAGHGDVSMSEHLLMDGHVRRKVAAMSAVIDLLEAAMAERAA